MKVIRKKADAEGAAAPAPAAAAAPKAGGISIKVVNRAPPAPVVSQEEVDSKKIAKLLERLTLGEHDAHCDGEGLAQGGHTDSNTVCGRSVGVSHATVAGCNHICCSHQSRRHQ